MAKKRKETTQKYAFKRNRYLPAEVQKVGAQVCGEAIEAATDDKGIVDKQKIVEQARPVRAPLHPCFEWNDPKAATLYREYQARNIVNAVTIDVKGHTVGAFPSVSVKVIEQDESEQVERRNIRVQDMLNDPELRQQKINEVLNRLIRIRNEYRMLNELEVVWTAVDQMVGAV